MARKARAEGPTAGVPLALRLVGEGEGGEGGGKGKRGRVVDRWEGGPIYVTASGRKVYRIERKVGDRRYLLSTGARTYDGAIAELRKFEANPAGYRPGGDARGSLLLDRDLVAEFLGAQKGKEVSANWRRLQRFYLGRWSEALRGRDLRHLDLDRDVLPALAKYPSRPHMVAVLKRLFAYLRSVEGGRKIKPGEDPTLDALPCVRSRPAQLGGPSKVIPVETLAAVRARIDSEVYAAGFDVLRGTGWHVSELYRFAAAGEVEELPEVLAARYRAIAAGKKPPTPRKAPGGILVTFHKRRRPHRTRVSPEVLRAALVVRANGGFCVSRFYSAIKAACDAAGVKRFGPGRLRHSLLYWAIHVAGVNPTDASAFVGHASEKTTQDFYATHAAPAKIATPI